MKNHIPSLLAVLSFASLASAQLQVGSLSIKGGETFTVGQVVDVSVIQTYGKNNGKYDFYFSKDNGTKWTELVGNYQGPKEDGATVTWKWTVGNTPTTQGMFRVCELAGGECTDPAYVLKSGAFTIVAAGTGLVQAGAGAAPFLGYDAATRSLNAAFDLAVAQDATVRAYDAGGRLLATLLEGRQEAGSHRYSLFSNRLEAVAGPVIFKLTLGREEFSRVVDALR